MQGFYDTLFMLKCDILIIKDLVLNLLFNELKSLYHHQVKKALHIYKKKVPEVNYIDFKLKWLIFVTSSSKKHLKFIKN